MSDAPAPSATAPSAPAPDGTAPDGIEPGRTELRGAERRDTKAGQPGADRLSDREGRLGSGTTDGGLPANFRRVVSFHPRGGRLNPVQRRAFDAHAAQWYLELDDLAGGLDVVSLFGRKGPLTLEIGSGMGEATAAMAAARPETNILAVEVYKPGVAQTFHHLSRAGVDNVRVVRADAVRLLTESIEPGSLAELWLFFPDPWPKTRHLKRRLVNPEFVELAASRLEKGGVLRMETDWAPYAQQMLAVCTGSRALRNSHAGWAPRPRFRPPTRFERRGLNAGHDIFDLEFVRR